MQNNPFSLSIVVIGRNQAPRLKECLNSIKVQCRTDVSELFYIDTASSDNSAAIAQAAGAVCITIDPPIPSAAIARNVGWKLAKSPFILFLDGDTLLARGFIEHAMPLFLNPKVAAVCGHRKERWPEASIYQQVFDLDWIYPAGETEFCGGDVIMRRSVLELVNGYNGSLVAGEEPELCNRIRAAGFKIIRLDMLMTKHDLGITLFTQYWKRCFRTGYAYAAVSSLTSISGAPFWRTESIHNFFKGGAMLLLGLAAIIASPWSAWPMCALVLIAIIMIVRTMIFVHAKGVSLSTCFWYGLHAHFQHIPMLCGQLSFYFKQRNKIIEYH